MEFPGRLSELTWRQWLGRAKRSDITTPLKEGWGGQGLSPGGYSLQVVGSREELGMLPDSVWGQQILLEQQECAKREKTLQLTDKSVLCSVLLPVLAFPSPAHKWPGFCCPQNLQWARDVLLGSGVPWQQLKHMPAQGLFCERNKTNFFNVSLHSW